MCVMWSSSRRVSWTNEISIATPSVEVASHAGGLSTVSDRGSSHDPACCRRGTNRPDVDAYGLMRGIGNLCIGADDDPDYNARRMVQLVIAGLRPD